MNISEIFIRRPVATTLLAVALTAAGLFAFKFIPVAALPDVDYPIVTVSAQLPGASPDTMATSVATPLIKQFSTVPAIQSMTSTSVQGSTSIVIQFDLDRDIDQAAADVQAAIARTLRQLPENMPTPPSYRKVNPADAPILMLALTSTTMPMPKLDDFAEEVISPALSTLEGVGEVQVLGAQQFAVRVELDPDALAARGIGLDEVTAAVAANNSIAPVGTLNGTDQQIAIETNTQLADAAAFKQLIVAAPDGKPVRLGDVARVIDSVANTQTASTYDGTPSLVLAVFRQPGANTVDVVDRVRAMLPSFEQNLGPGARLNVLNDRSVSIAQAVRDVEITLGITVLLVLLVIFVFLRRVSVTVIPALAVPISLIATCGAMYLLGFSVDNISLLGLTLSVGLIVDDAIVMLENIMRHIEAGMPPFEAALHGSGEIGFTIVSITLSLVAVFIPVLLMGGVVGRLFNEFAVVVTIAITASALVSLTLTPMLVSRLPARRPDTRRRSEAPELFGWLLAGYRRSLDLCLEARPVVLVVFLATVAAAAALFVAIPKGFLPQEDIGQLSISTEARQDVSFADMMALQQQVAETLQGRPYTAHVASVVGSGIASSTANQGNMFVELKPKGERPPLPAILDDVRRSLAQIPGISAYAVPVQNLQDRRRLVQEPVPVRRAGDRSRRARRLGQQARRRHEPRRDLRRRHHRSAGECAPGERRHRRGQGLGARHQRRAAAEFAQRRFRHQPGLDHLRDRRQL